MTEKARRIPLTAAQYRKKFAELGLTVNPDFKPPPPRALSKRYRRELDEITLSKPNTSKTDNEK